ncbi:MAG: VWA domain-containing protein [Pirellulales bacterium]
MNERITTWLLTLFGVAPPPAGEGTTWQFAGDWQWSPPLVLLFAALTVAGSMAIVSLYLTERAEAGHKLRLALAAVRISLLLLVLFVMLFGLKVMFNRTSLPYLAIIVDESASMEHVDAFDPRVIERLAQRAHDAGFDSPTRINLAKALLLSNNAAALREQGNEYQVQFYFVAGAARRPASELTDSLEALRELEAIGKSSRLGSGIREVLDDLRGTQPAAIVVFTDGVNTDGPGLVEAAQYARRKGVKLIMIGVGSETPAKYLELRDLLVDRVVFVDDYVDFQFKVEAGGLAGQTVDVILREADSPAVLARERVAISADLRTQEARISYRPTEEGEKEYVIEIENPPTGLPEKPRRLTQRVRVEKAKIRVLLAQGYPNYEYRFLKHLLERDPTIELSTVLQEADLEYAEDDQSALRVFPVNKDDLAEYDVLIFGDLNPAYLSSSVLQNISDFVTELGRGMIIISGPEFNPSAFQNTPLATLLPIDRAALSAPRQAGPYTQGFAARLSDFGATHAFMQLGDSREQTQRIWATLPELYWMHEADRLKRGVRVLAEHPTKTDAAGQRLPLLALHFIPPGKVLWHATDETYRWRENVGDAYFARYWIQAIRYLARSKFADENADVEITTERENYDRGDAVQVRVRFFDDRRAPLADDGVSVVVESEDKKKMNVTLSRDPQNRSVFAAEAGNLPSGRYRAWVATPALASRAATEFVVRPPAGETDEKQLDVVALKEAAEQSRGEYFNIADLNALPIDLPRGRAVQVESLPPVELWNNWRVLTLFLALLVTEWLLRKRKGMM